jgi:hypothetical protein
LASNGFLRLSNLGKSDWHDTCASLLSREARPNRESKYSQKGKEEKVMEKITRMYLKAREMGKRLSKGQTMTEYALILAAVAIVVSSLTR